MKHFLLLAALLGLASCKKDSDAALDDDTNGACSDADLKVVSTHPNLFLAPPNVITPNNDGLNDAFLVVVRDKTNPNPVAQVTFAIQTLKVYHKGSTTPVYNSPNYDGRFDGHDNGGAVLAEGLYRYELMLDDNSVTGDLRIVHDRKACQCRPLDLGDPLLLDKCP